MAKIFGNNDEWDLVNWPYQYTDIHGNLKQGYGNHRINRRTLEEIPIRQFQNRQKAARIKQGETIRQPEQRVGGIHYTRTGNTDVHGDTISLYFRDLLEAQLWFYQQYAANNDIFQEFPTWIIQARYTTRNAIRFGTSDPKDPRYSQRKKKKKFTTLSPTYAEATDLAMGTFIWDVAGQRLQEGFSMGSDSAIILYGVEY